MATLSPETSSTAALVGQECRLQMSYDAYLAWTDEDVHAEWVNGEVIVHMPPQQPHQRVVTFLLQLVGMFMQLFRLGRLLLAPFEMRVVPQGVAREPDLLFVAQQHLDRLTEARLNGPADRVVEVVSDDSVTRDRVDKFGEYQAAGIPEYWIIDPRPDAARVDVYVLDATGQYQGVPVDPDGRYHSTVLPGFWLREEWLLAVEPPDVLQTLAQIVGVSTLMEALRPHGGTTD
ncbi:MAG: Uma2 family endonuclease [Candidatus Tectimicrobiota bacterium]